MNGDRYPDIAIVATPPYTYGAEIAIVTNKGGVSFAVTSTPGIGSIPQGVTAGDLNGDSKIDLAVAVTTDEAGQSGLNILTNNGDGTFKMTGVYSTGSFNCPQAGIADVNGDGIPDIAVSDCTDNNMGVLFGNGDGYLQSVQYYSDAPYPSGWQIADVDGDGHPDLVTPNASTNNVSILRNLGNWTFAPRIQFRVGAASTRGCATPPLNCDGRPDVVVSGVDLLPVLINRSR